MKLWGVDLFAGSGGLSLGANQAGISTLIAIESDKDAAKTFTINHPSTKMLHTDIRNVDKIDIDKQKRPLIVFGGPPCQGFSTSNQKTRLIDNGLNWLFQDFIRIVKLLEPEWVLFENVKGFLITSKGHFKDIVLNELVSLGYTVTCKVVNALEFGVPQKRERVIIIGNKNGISVDLPSPPQYPIITVHDAISDLPDLVNGACINELPYKSNPVSVYAENMRKNLNVCQNHLVTNNSVDVLTRYQHIPQGGNWMSIPDELMHSYSNRFHCHSGIYRRLKEDEPSIVIGNYRKNMLIHPNQNRGLSVREVARLQSFPDDYVFFGNLGSQQQQVSNAVPPLLAKSIFQEIVKYEISN